MFAFETNAQEIFAAIRGVLLDTPRILEYEQDRLEATIRVGLEGQFDALSGEETVIDASGAGIAWYGVSDMTAAVREDFWHVSPFEPVLVVTGALKHAVENGTTLSIKDGPDSHRLVYLPGQDQQEKIDKHESGFVVTEPVSEGRYSPPRPILFWGENVTGAVMEGLERGLENLIKSRGF